MVTLDEEFYTSWVSHVTDDELIQKFISVMAMFSSPYLPDFSLGDVLCEMEEILLYEAMKRFIISSGSLSAVDAYKRYFGFESLDNEVTNND